MLLLPRNTTSEADTNNNTQNDANASSQSISIVPGSGSPGSDLFFDPSPAKVVVGNTITWTNDDTLPHTVTSGNPEKGPSSTFDSGIMSAGDSFTFTFDKPGVLEYYCAVHPWMISTRNGTLDLFQFYVRAPGYNNSQNMLVV